MTIMVNVKECLVTITGANFSALLGVGCLLDIVFIPSLPPIKKSRYYLSILVGEYSIEYIAFTPCFSNWGVTTELM